MDHCLAVSRLGFYHKDHKGFSQRTQSIAIEMLCGLCDVFT